MKKVLRSVVGLSLGVTLALSVAGGAFAAGSNHADPGTPGDANCVGQTMAYLAQVGPQLGINPGIGNLASAVGASAQDVKTIVEQYCASSS